MSARAGLVEPLSLSESRMDRVVTAITGMVPLVTAYTALLVGFSDGLPVTLRFADLVREVLMAGPTSPNAPLPFKFYI